MKTKTTTAAMLAAAVLAGGGAAIVSTTAGSHPSSTKAAAPPPALMFPEPPWGARVILGGVEGTSCSQVASVKVKSTTKGVLYRSGGSGERWVTKAQRVSGDPGALAPPAFRGKMAPGVWTLTDRFQPKRLVYRVWFANSNCPGTTLAFKWNATTVTVAVVP